MAQDKTLAAAVARLTKLEKQDSFDPAVPGSKPTPDQQAFLNDIDKYKVRVIRAGNRSGKGATAARELAWILTNTHPHWTRPPEWGTGPMQVLVAGQTLTNMETEIWNKKLSPFLNLGDWRQVRQGQQLKAARNKVTGDEIIFLSHADSSEKNRRAMQGYTAHYVWLDEMPGSVGILQEIMDRAATNGMFVATFTPKFKSEEIRKAIDALDGEYGRIYRFRRLDNPLFQSRMDEELAKLEGMSENMRNSILYGDWYAGDSSVYEWAPERMEKEPEGYSRAWRHVLSIDPAVKSKFGFTLWAEEPRTGIWYLVRDDYIQGIYDPRELHGEVQKRCEGYNIVRRVCDPHESWFIATASSNGVSYITPYDKNNRKHDLIKGLQSALSSGKIKISPWCTVFKDEIQACQWSETTDKIVNSSSFHTLDSAQYFVDVMPKEPGPVPNMSWHEELRRGNQKRKKQEAVAKKYNKNTRMRPVRMWGQRRRAGW